MKAILLDGTAAAIDVAVPLLYDTFMAAGLQMALLADTSEAAQPALQTVHRSAGATTLNSARRWSLQEVMQAVEADVLVCHGMQEALMARLLLGTDAPTADCVGVLTPEGQLQLRDGAVFDVRQDAAAAGEALTRLLYEPLPNLNCYKCGRSCTEMAAAIAGGTAQRGDCRADSDAVEVTLDGKRMALVPYVARITHNVVLGLVKELKGFSHPQEIVVRLRSHDETTGRQAMEEDNGSINRSNNG